MILNKDFLIKEMCEIICDETSSHIKHFNDIHDIGINIGIGDFCIEEYDMLYWEMYSILNQEIDYIINELNIFLNNNQPYYGDPAFSSKHDYWEYILG